MMKLTDLSDLSDFDACFAALIDHEGGYVDHPNDPGGRTKYGISQRAYPQIDIKALTLEQAKQIYWRDYWVKCGADDLPASMRLAVFDCAVNSGLGLVTRLLKESGNNPVLFCAMRLEYLTTLSTWSSFGKGWARRMAANLRASVTTEQALAFKIEPESVLELKVDTVLTQI